MIFRQISQSKFLISIRMVCLYVLIPKSIYNLNISKQMASKNSNTINDQFLELQYISQETQNKSNISGLPNNYKPIDDHTCAVAEEDPSILSCLKSGQRDYEISFQACFMDEHQDAFKIQMKNFMESCFKNYKTKQISFQSYEIFGEQLQINSFTNQENILDIFQDKQQILKEIKSFQKIYKFFEFVFKNQPCKVASQILYLSQLGKERFRRILQNKSTQYDNLLYLGSQNETFMNSTFLSQEQLMNHSKVFAKQLCEDLFYNEKINYLNFRNVQKSELNSQQEIKKSFERLLEFLFSTIMFLTQQFFQNPYGQNFNTKRERASFEDYYEVNQSEQQSSSTDSIKLGKPMKKIH